MKTINLTKTAIAKALESAKAPCTLRVNNLRWARIRIGKDSVSYCYERTLKQKKYQFTLGDISEYTIEEFIHWAGLRTAEISSPYYALRRVTLDSLFFQFYVKRKEGIKKSLNNDIGRYNKHIKASLGSLKITEIGVLDIQSVLLDISSNQSPATHNRVLALLSAIFSFAAQFDLVSTNPCRKIPSLPEPKCLERYLSDIELSAFVKACSHDNSVFSDCLLLALYTGMRIGNCVALKRSMLSSDRKSITLPDTKSGKPQTLWLSEPALNLVMKRLEKGGSSYLFPSTQDPDQCIGYPRSTFIRVCRTAGIAVKGSQHPITYGFSTEYLTIHCLRKTYASLALAETADIYTVSKLLGHGSVSVTERYAFITKEKLVSSSQSIGCRFAHLQKSPSEKPLMKRNHPQPCAE